MENNQQLNQLNQQLNQHHQQQQHQPQQQHHQPSQHHHHPPPQTGMPPPPPPPLPYPTRNPYHHLLQHQRQQLQRFWNLQRQEIEQTTDFKTHQLPLARIKKIMKADEDVRMISADAPILFSKACEMFILELTYRSWLHAEENKRRTLQKNDISAAISRSDIFDFLVDIVPREENRDDGTHGIGGIMSAAGASSSSVPYYYPHMGQDQQPQTSVMMGRSSMPTMQTLPPLPPMPPMQTPMQTMPTMPTMPMVDPGMYAQLPSQAWQSVWQTGVDDGPYEDCGNMGPDLDDGHGDGHAYVYSFSLL
ncbi:nuclear transcription factor Y subunit C-1-like [Impatiens glandulifera]|uniref:nuclear transcription factor Y subunit C-1-like n=1 Tax=Impatiens glandulifera TaxID=253017 RepID=UPI001FB0FD8A|nr:nuclear transcription factor Y subunit C-1-like [Impatiens glandulifera]